MELPESLETLSVYPSSPADAPDGKYAIHTQKKKHREAYGPDIEYSTWFRTPSLDVTTIQRLQSLQLFTESKDQDFCDDEALGTWTWFELAIMENADAKVPRVKDGIQLSWTSHKNVLNCGTYTWLEGALFPTDHDIFRLVEKNNVIAVRLCARFNRWKLTARNAYLVVELGPAVERESLSFGSIASRVKGIEGAFYDINKAVFPDLDRLPSVPDTLFRAEMMSTAAANERPLRVLSLDGGGVRGLAALLMLQRIMEKSCPGKKPCEVFDMIGGTSTGGFIAIMLGRLEMTIEDCITSYTKFMGEVFPPNTVARKMPFGLGTLFDVTVKGEKWDSRVLEKVIKRLVKEQLGQDPETVLLQDPKNPNPSCKVFVTATSTKGANNHGPVLLRSYTNPLQMPELPEIKLWEAARATSAAPTYFTPMKVKEHTFVDGGLQANNPLGWLWNEVLQVHGPLRATACFLSVGTGMPPAQALPSSVSRHPLDFVGGLTGVATNSEIMNIMFRSLLNAFAPRGMAKKYWRFSVGDGLPDWVEGEDGEWRWVLREQREERELGQLDDVKMIGVTRDRAEEYMRLDGFETMVGECAAALGGLGGGSGAAMVGVKA